MSMKMPYGRGSQTAMSIRIAWRTQFAGLHPLLSNSVDLSWGLRICFSSKFLKLLMLLIRDHSLGTQTFQDHSVPCNLESKSLNHHSNILLKVSVYFQHILFLDIF